MKRLKVKKRQYKINLYCINCSIFTKITVKRNIDGKINLYSRCIDHSFKDFETAGEEEFSGVLKV